MTSKSHLKALAELSADRRLAHEVLFKHRHPLPTPEFHGDMIDAFHGPDPKVVEEAARGFAKSTIGEEGTCIGAVLFDFMNGLIVGSTEGRAKERLGAIKHELENNENIIELDGEQVGDIWQAHKIVLKNGVCLQALGVGQAVRGVKHNQYRPDFVWLDDIEDDDSVKTAEASRQRMTWLYKTLLPVCSKGARVRLTGNRLSPDAVVKELAEDPDWKALRHPITHFDLLTGVEAPTWPELYDMEWIVKTRAEYDRRGLSDAWASEYMCEATSEAAKSFKPENIHTAPRVRTWHMTQAIWDPAKTSKNTRQQSHYAKVVGSWIGHKLVVWDAYSRPLQPSEMIADIFATDTEFTPVSLHVEQDGLEEWLMEPLKLEQIKRRHFLPHLVGERAPKDKIGFIRALQPHFVSNEVEFAKDLPELKAALLNFPSGKIDAANALAYFLKIRPGRPMYEGFTEENIREDLSPTIRSKLYLCLNTDGSYVTGALAQFDGTLAVIADWIEGGDTGTCVDLICKQAALAAGGRYDVVVHPKEMDQYRNKGLVAALRRIPRQFTTGTEARPGREQIAGLLALRRAQPLLLCSDQATWTVRAFAGGYHAITERSGNELNEPEAGPYTTLMEGLESFAGIMSHAESGEDVGFQGSLYRQSRGGVLYKSLIGAPLQQNDDKANYMRAR